MLWTRLGGRAGRRLVLLAACLVATTSVVRAHSPHDVVNAMDVVSDPGSPAAILASAQLTDHRLIVRSLDGGRTFTIHALPVLERGIAAVRFSPTFGVDKTAFIATTDLGLLKSTDRGNTWQLLPGGGLPPNLLSLAPASDFATSQRLVCGTDFGVYSSADGGASWTLGGAGLTETKLFVLRSTSVSGAEVVFGGAKVFARSDDGGATWTPLHTFPVRMRSLSLSPGFAVDQTAVVCLDGNAGVFVTTDGGVTWNAMNVGLLETLVNDVTLADDGSLLAVTRVAGLHRAAGPLQPWTPVIAPGFEVLSELTTNHYRSVRAASGFAATGRIFMGAFEGLFISDDGGASFRQGDIYSQRLIRRAVIAPDDAGHDAVYAVNYGGGLYRFESGPPQGSAPGGPQPVGAATLPGGSLATSVGADGPGFGAPSSSHGPRHASAISTWRPLSRGVEALFGQELVLSPDFADDGVVYYAQIGMYRSDDRGAHWQEVSIPPTVQVVRTMALSPTFASDGLILFGSGLGETVYRSEDAGQTWTESDGGLPSEPSATTILFSPDYAGDGEVFLASKDHGFHRSTDGGLSWAPSNAGLTDKELRTLEASPDYGNDHTLFAGSVNQGLFRSVDGGLSWHAVNSGLAPGVVKSVESIALSPTFGTDDTLYVATLAGGVYRSNDRGDTWFPVGAGLPVDPSRVVALSPDFAADSTVVVATMNWIYRSHDAGLTWKRLPGYNRFDDLDHMIVEEGLWTSTVVPGAHGEGYTRSDQAGARVTFHFRGASVRWFSARGPSMGIAEVFVDDGPAVTVDLYAAEDTATLPVFVRSFGDTGFHVIRVVVTGMAHPSAAGARIVTDGFDTTF